MTLLADVLRLLLQGLQQGAIYILLAVGLSIILGTLKFVNFAHGALYLIGLYVGLLVSQTTSFANGQVAEWGYATLGLGWGFLAALVIAPIVVFVVGLLMERFVARPFYDRSPVEQILITFGLAIVIQQLFRLLFSGSSHTLDPPAWAAGPVALPVVGNFSEWRLWVIAITAVLVFLVYVLIERTDFGLVVRAGTQDAEMVELLGIEIDRAYLIVFAIGAALAGIAGVINGPIGLVNPTVGTDILVPAFVVVVIGGLGSIRGAVVGGLLLGLTEAFFVLWTISIPALGINYGLSAWSSVAIYALAAIVLLLRPQGLFGREVDLS
jgi:branched-chain amino acid transport system permease protein